MDEKLKIKISIADRVYPLTVDLSQEEGLRTASKKIDVMMKQFEENYAVRDKQDVLAMCALQFASQAEQNKLTTLSMERNIERIKNQCAFRSISRQLNVLYRN
jgi:cell division protein ZapA